VSDKYEASADDYIDLAREINLIAGDSLKLKTREASLLSTKVSLGLSLQAAELAGKAMLRSLGFSVKEIRKKHKNHKILDLLQNAAEEIKSSSNERVSSYGGFLLYQPTIEGQKYGNTIGGYFQEHFDRGLPANPRNYFYPDEESFTGPSPIQAVFYMVEYLIEVAQDIVDLCRKQQNAEARR